MYGRAETWQVQLQYCGVESDPNALAVVHCLGANAAIAPGRKVLYPRLEVLGVYMYDGVTSHQDDVWVYV